AGAGRHLPTVTGRDFRTQTQRIPIHAGALGDLAVQPVVFVTDRALGLPLGAALVRPAGGGHRRAVAVVFRYAVVLRIVGGAYDVSDVAVCVGAILFISGRPTAEPARDGNAGSAECKIDRVGGDERGVDGAVVSDPVSDVVCSGAGGDLRGAGDAPRWGRPVEGVVRG